MKKLLFVFAIIIMAFAFAGCGSKSENSGETEPTTEVTEKNTDEETSKEALDDKTDNKTKILVACFSATGNTKSVAEKIALSTKGDLFEIAPKVPYTKADLNYSDSNSRTSVEMNDISARPEIENIVENMAEYDIIYLGYPIWWGEAPRIMSTFVESYDLKGKTIVPFCTSGSSPIGSSAKSLEKLSEGKWLEGKRFSTNTSQDEINKWVDEQGLNIN